MDKMINYDFDAAKTASDNLESVSDSISREIVSVISSKIDDISNYWNDDASIRFIKGLDGINEEIDRIQKNLLSQSEKIKTASRHMKIAEEEAEKIAKTRDTDVIVCGMDYLYNIGGCNFGGGSCLCLCFCQDEKGFFTK